MRKKPLFLLPILLLATSLSSCGSGAEGLTTEKFYSVNGNYLTVYNDGTTDCLTFYNGVATYTYYSWKTKQTDRREKAIEASAYFKAADKMLYIANNAWTSVYNFEAQKDITKPERPSDGYSFWGEYGDGWFKQYSSSSQGYTTSSLYVTEKYAKEAGLIINRYDYAGANRGYECPNLRRY